MRRVFPACCAPAALGAASSANEPVINVRLVVLMVPGSVRLPVAYSACSSIRSKTCRPSSGLSFCELTQARSFISALPSATA